MICYEFVLIMNAVCSFVTYDQCYNMPCLVFVTFGYSSFANTSAGRWIFHDALSNQVNALVSESLPQSLLLVRKAHSIHANHHLSALQQNKGQPDAAGRRLDEQDQPPEMRGDRWTSVREHPCWFIFGWVPSFSGQPSTSDQMSFHRKMRV